MNVVNAELRKSNIFFFLFFCSNNFLIHGVAKQNIIPTIRRLKWATGGSRERFDVGKILSKMNQSID